MKKTIKIQKLLPVGALSISLLIHLTILLGISGVILIQAIPPKITPIGDSNAQAIPDNTPLPPEIPDENIHPNPETLPDQDTSRPEPSPIQLNPEQIINKTPDAPMILAPTNLVGATDSGIAAQQIPPKQENADKNNPEQKVVKAMPNPFGILNNSDSSGGLIGHMYDLKQTADRQKSELAGLGKGDWNSPEESKANDGTVQLLTKFIAGNWNTGILQKYYRFEKEISTYQLFILPLSDVEGPKAFGADKKIQPRRWIIHYAGKFTSPVSGSYRFVGFGDDYFVVRFNSKTVLDGSLHRLTQNPEIRELLTPAKGIRAEQTLYGGSWITLSEGQTYPIEVLVGELPGGVMYSFLLMQKKNEKYEFRQNNKDLGPILPVIQFVPTKLPKYQPETNGPTVAKEFFICQ